MNLMPIKSLCQKYKGGIKGLAISVGMTEQNLHRCIRENRIQAQDLEKIAKELNIGVGFFFDEPEIITSKANRDLYINSQIRDINPSVRYNKEESQSLPKGKGRSSCNTDSFDIQLLKKTISILESQLKDKERIIKFYEAQNKEKS